ncbi:MAG: hypothetical protein AAFR20_04690 [Pseudomonadota bacterium]
MDVSLVIGFALSVLRVLRVRRSTTIRTAIIALICLGVGTACEVVIVYLQQFGLDDPRLLAGVTAQLLTETLLEALPFTVVVLALQRLRQFVR